MNNEIIIETAYDCWKVLRDADEACESNPIINGKSTKGYIALKAKFDAIMELVSKMNLTNEFVEYVNKAEGEKIYITLKVAEA